ncbi:MAG: DUF2029 domain-containing protein [Planctomycetia bacterium]|nr:DUF2029 domain-containing protein [Planctomycetia bacterium]
MSDRAIRSFGAAPPAVRWPLYLCLFVALVVWCAVDVQRRGRIDPNRPELHRTDFTCFTEAGAAFFDGRDPYAVTNVRGWGYCYPPMFALLVAPLSTLDPRWQVTVWFFISAAAVWGCYRECARIARHFAAASTGGAASEGEFPRWLVWAAVAVSLFPVLNCLQRGQVDVVKLYLVLLGFRLCVAGTTWRAWFGGGAALAAAVVLKLTPLLPLAVLGAMLVARLVFRPLDDSRSGGRAIAVGLGATCGAVALLLIAPAAFLGWNANLGYIERFHHEKVAKVNDFHEADRTGNTRTLRNQSLSNAVIRLGDFIGYEFLGGYDDRLIDRAWPDSPPMVMDDPGVDRVLLVSRAAVLALLGVAGLLAVLRGDRLAQGATFGLACAAALVVSPISRGYYFAELAPGVLLLPLWLDRRGMPVAARVVAWAPAVLVGLHYGLLPVTGRLGVLGLGTTVWCATGLLLVAVGGRLKCRRAAAFVQAPQRRKALAQAANIG